MNPGTLSIEQQARITQIKGNVQLIRDGFFLPAQVGQALLPGDRLISADNARATVQFTGVQDALVIEKGGAATFNLEVIDADQVPQWIATNLEGDGVFFENTQQAASQFDNTPTMGLFGNSAAAGEGGNNSQGTGNQGTGYPVLEVTAGLLATAAIYSDYDSDDTLASGTEASAPGNTSGSGTGTGGNTPGGQGPETPSPETPAPETPTEPAAGPLDALLAPISGLTEGTPLAALGTIVPLGSLALPSLAGGADPLGGLPAVPGLI